MPAELAFEREAASSRRMDGLYFWALVLLVGGVLAMLCWRSAAALPVGAASAGAGIWMYAYLLRAAPVRVWFRCCWIDSAGLHHIEGDDPAGRTAHYAWSEIERAETSDPGDEFRGIILFLRRAGMRHVPVRLTLDENASAVAAIREWIGSPPQNSVEQPLKLGLEER